MSFYKGVEGMGWGGGDLGVGVVIVWVLHGLVGKTQ